MCVETFKSGVQYGDMKGTVSADRHDTKDIYKYLRDNKRIEDNEFLAGITLDVGEIHQSLGDKSIYLSVFICKDKGYENFKAALDSGKELTLHKIDVKITPVEFLSMFKRFNLTLSPYGNLEGKSFRVVDEI